MFTVTSGGIYTIHTLGVRSQRRWTSAIVVPGVTTGFDVNCLLDPRRRNESAPASMWRVPGNGE